jgi:nucleoid-associated protein YgaU
MQMFKYLLLIAALFLSLSGCAKPPEKTLTDARSSVARAYAAGAAQYAPGEYQLAKSALEGAETQIEDKQYAKASRTLELARRYSTEALRLTTEKKQQLALEEQKLAEQKRLAEAEKRRELARKAAEKERLAKKKRALRKAKPVPAAAPKKVAPVVEKPVLVDKVEVQAGENLATIAAKEQVYQDALLWPLIYKANRDQIKKPDEIFSGQILMIPRDKTAEEIEAARQEARTLNLFQPLD